MYPEDPTRAQLAENAAGLLLQGRAAALPGLRPLLLAEAAAAPAPTRALDISAETAALCEALQRAVRRRSWLYFAPAEVPQPAAVPRALLQCALLCFVQGALAADTPAVVQLRSTPGAAVLALRGGTGRTLPGDARALLLRLAAVCGGAVVQSGGRGPFGAALRLPPAAKMPVREPLQADDYLLDRFSPLYTILGKSCALPG